MGTKTAAVINADFIRKWLTTYWTNDEGEVNCLLANKKNWEHIEAMGERYRSMRWGDDSELEEDEMGVDESLGWALTGLIEGGHEPPLEGHLPGCPYAPGGQFGKKANQETAYSSLCLHAGSDEDHLACTGCGCRCHDPAYQGWEFPVREGQKTAEMYEGYPGWEVIPHTQIQVGDIIGKTNYAGQEPGKQAEILRPAEESVEEWPSPLAGRPVWRYWARSLADGREGYLDYGAGGVALRKVSKTARKTAEDQGGAKIRMLDDVEAFMDGIYPYAAKPPVFAGQVPDDIREQALDVAEREWDKGAYWTEAWETARQFLMDWWFKQGARKTAAVPRLNFNLGGPYAYVSPEGHESMMLGWDLFSGEVETLRQDGRTRVIASDVKSKEKFRQIAEEFFAEIFAEGSRKTAADRPEPWPEMACGEQDDDTFCIRDAGHEEDHQFRSRYWIEQKLDESGATNMEDEAEEEQSEEAPQEGEEKKGEVPEQFKKGVRTAKYENWNYTELPRLSDEELVDRIDYFTHEADGPGVSAALSAHLGEQKKRESKESMRKGAPFADYKDFEDCTSKNSDKDDPDAYCGYIKHKVEDSKEGQRIASVILPRLSYNDFLAVSKELVEIEERK